MKFSLNFVKEVVDPKIPATELAYRLSMVGMEVEHLEKVGGDWVFDTEVTSNRYDWLSIVGIAREIACICGKTMKLKLPQILQKPLFKEKDIIIENEEDCRVYIGRLIHNIKVKESPRWLIERVTNCGLSSVNNVVDITNYCMLKWGCPLHAFDYDKIEGDIYVRRAKDKEKFMGIDGKERVLSPHNLVIADDRKIIALAGVIGAKNTEVDTYTKNIFLEAAIFSPLTIRCSRREVGLETESSYRFERWVFPGYLDRASSEVSSLIISLCEGEFGGYRKKGQEPLPRRKKLLINFIRLSDYLGKKIPLKEAITILKNLEFKIQTVSQEKVEAIPPLFRLDIEREVDIYEEIARFYGYEKIPPSLPMVLRKTENEMYEFKKALRSFLVSLGLTEIITYSIVSEELLRFLKEEKIMKIVNPLRKQENALRSTLLCGAIEAVRYNLNQWNRDLTFFELANIYVKKEKGYTERLSLGIAVTGESSKALYLKGVVETIARFLTLPVSFQEKERKNFTNALEIVNGKKPLGFLGKLDNSLKEKLRLKEDLYFVELNVERLFKERRKRLFTPFSKYPSLYRDISIGLHKRKMFKEIEEIVKKKASHYLQEIELIDIYKGKNLPGNFYGLTVRVRYQSLEKTLTSEEVDYIHNSIREELAGREGIILR